MNKRFFFLIFLFFSCSTNQDNIGNEKPKDLIPKNKMAVILKDLMLVESHFQIKYGSMPNYKEGLLVSSDSLFKSHGVNEKQFDRSYNYYMTQSGELHYIYKQILDTLNVDYAKVNSQINK
tara:strand:+ start:32 stop:394 length:363 start_codon:yes stop_codon:yes gene_type:complete